MRGMALYGFCDVSRLIDVFGAFLLASFAPRTDAYETCNSPRGQMAWLHSRSFLVFRVAWPLRPSGGAAIVVGELDLDVRRFISATYSTRRPTQWRCAWTLN